MQKKQVFKSAVLTRAKVRNNILKVWNMSDDQDRYDWYQSANDWCASLSHLSGLSLIQTAGIVAALSPVKTWDQNLECAHGFVMRGEAKHMGQFMDKAARIKNVTDISYEQVLEILNGRKISSFFINILHPDKSTNVTIDRHALSVALDYWVSDEEYSGMTKKQYEFFRDCHIWTADSIGVSPLRLQSATWVVFRRIKKEVGRKI
jgi:hypothetical protein